VNKMDRVDWSEERFNDIQQQTTTFLTSANFSPSQITFVPCAGLSGDNILNRASSPNASWYTGPTLVQVLDSVETAASNARSKPLLLVISDVFSNATSSNSTSIAGRLEAGSIQSGDQILLQPAGETATVRSIDVDDNPVDWAVSGQIVTLNIVDVDTAHIHRGDVASDPKFPLRTTNRFTVKILTFEHVLPMFVDVLRGRMQVPGKVAELVAILDKATGRPIGKRKPRVLQPGVAARVVLEVEREVPIADGWRVVLRTEGRSIAAGLVESEATSS
jgi:elongation factor 1 alpha-like protein